MTDVLADILRKEYPPLNGVERVSTYENNERIYLNLIPLIALFPPMFTDSNKIFEIAKNTFDVPFKFEKRGDIGEAVFFEPAINDKYHQNHFGHYIHIDLPFSYPLITIFTGNRGAVSLIAQQRQRYFDFVNKVYKSFQDNAEGKFL